MSDNNHIKEEFLKIYNHSTRLASAVFLVVNLIDKDQEIKTKIKSLSLSLIADCIAIKDINLTEIKNPFAAIEKLALELMALLEVASVSGLISKMNGDVLRGEFQSFIKSLNNFMQRQEQGKAISLQSVFGESLDLNNMEIFNPEVRKIEATRKNNQTQTANIKTVNEHNEDLENGHKRKFLRKKTILDFIKNHNQSSIKDIAPHIIGCSEKTIQRELMELINEGKIMKTGERRWSRYSIIV